MLEETDIVHNIKKPSDRQQIWVMLTKEKQQKSGQKSSEFVIYVTDEVNILIS